MSLFQELKRRNVIRVATAYVVVAWLIVQVVETVFPAFGFGDEAIRTAVIVLAIGFVPVVILSWFFELTPDGLKRDAEVAGDERSNARWLDRAIVIGLVIAVGYFAVDKFVLDPARDELREAEVAEQARTEAVKGFYGDRSIAVLPFVNMSSDPEQAFFAEGISEEVLNLLASIRELRVISRSSAFRFTGRDLDIPDVARQLDVAHILEGSVRKAGNTIRVTAQLIEATTDTHLWSQTYDRQLEDIFAIQDEIAADVAKNLEIRLLQPLPKSRVTDPEVLALTAQAKHLLETRPDNHGRLSAELLEQALAIDPNYVPALEWMGSAIWFLEADGEISWDEYRARDAALTARIIAIEPENGSVDSGRAWHLAYTDRDLEGAAALFSRSVLRDPADSTVVRSAGQFARHIGRFEDAIRLGEHAVAIDPLCFYCLYHLSRTYMYVGRYEEALVLRERFLLLGSGGQYHYGLLLLLRGDAQAALEYFDAFPDDWAELRITGMAMAHFDLGNIDKAEELLQQLRSLEKPMEPYLVLEVLAWMNMKDEAFGLIEGSDFGDDFFPGFTASYQPVYRNLVDDPRWTAFRERIDRTEERLAAIEFNPVLPE